MAEAEDKNFDDVSAQADAAFNEMNAELARLDKAELSDKPKTGERPPAPKAKYAERAKKRGRDLVEKNTDRLSATEENMHTEETPYKFPALPDNFDVNIAAKRLPDEITGQSLKTRSLSLAQSSAALQANVNLLREIYKAVYGNAPERISGTISTYDIYSDGIKLTYKLNQEAKLRLIKDFVRQVSGS